MGINFIILHLFSLLDKRCIDTFADTKRAAETGSSLCLCVRREKKHASGWEDPLLIINILPIFFEIMCSV